MNSRKTAQYIKNLVRDVKDGRDTFHITNFRVFKYKIRNGISIKDIEDGFPKEICLFMRCRQWRYFQKYGVYEFTCCRSLKVAFLKTYCQKYLPPLIEIAPCLFNG